MDRRLILLCTLVIACCAPASADYVLTPLSGGQASATVEWGDAFTLDLVLTSDAGDVHNSAIFRLLFTEPGLIYESYDWSSPYVAAPPNDDSTPDLASLPAALDGDSFFDPANPSLVDLELSNVLFTNTFGAGVLASLEFTVPADFGFEGSVYISPQPDTFADGFDAITTTGGTIFELIVVPEPAAGMLIVLSACIAIRARRG